MSELVVKFLPNDQEVIDTERGLIAHSPFRIVFEGAYSRLEASFHKDMRCSLARRRCLETNAYIFLLGR